MIYLLHFSKKLKHAQHYLGYCEAGLSNRLARHRDGRGALILAEANRKGIKYRVVRKWTGAKADRRAEARLKRSFGGARLCPVCCGKSAMNRGKL